MGKNNIPLMSHIDSVMAKIAADKKAELGSTSFTSPGDGNTKPKDGGTYNDLKKNVNANAETANVGDANKNPGGEHAGSVAPILTSDDKSTIKVKSGKDVGETAGPKAHDQGSCKSAELANALLASIAELTKSAEDKKPEDKKSTEGTDTKVETPKDPKTGVELTEEEKKAALLVKEAAEKFPEAMAGGYAFAQKVASLLVQDADQVDPAQTKVASEAENDAIKVAEFLLGFTKTANEDMAALLGGAGGGMGGPEAGGVVPPEAAMAGGADLAGAGGGMPGGEAGGMGGGSEEEIIQALADALQAQGITPEQLAEALAAEQGGAGAGAGDMGGGMASLPNGGDSAGAAHEASESPAEEAKKPAAKEDSEEKEASLRKTAGYKTASRQVSDRLAELRKKGLLKVKK